MATTQLKREALIDESAPQHQDLLRRHKIAPEEYQRIKQTLERAPTLTELGIFSALWSEHCSYKSSKRHLRNLPTTGPDVVVGPGENAGILRLSGDLCVAFKMESHNHPSFIDPYQGSTTAVGGILRDVFCMGARPIANLNCLRFGARDHAKTPWLAAGVAKGIGDYGNCVGIPTVGGNIRFNGAYNDNIIVNAMTIGLIKESEIFKGIASGAGNLVVYVGSRTGRDGIQGATMASDKFSGEGSSKTTIQVGDPFWGKLLLEATLEIISKRLALGLQDMGAAGLTSSLFEMAHKGGVGMDLDLDRVPLRADNLTAYEILLSESQERMVMVVAPDRWPEVKTVLERWDLAAAVIGTVTNSGRIRATRNSELAAEIELDRLFIATPVYDRPMAPRMKVQAQNDPAPYIAFIHKHGWEGTALKLLGCNGDKAKVYTQFDRHIGGKTRFSSPEQGAAVLWIPDSTPHLGLLAATACLEHLCFADPRLGAAHSVAKAARMIAAAGGTPMGITDCLNYGNPEDAHVMWEFAEGIAGIRVACEALRIPVVSGNVSFYNQTNDRNIPPTPMIGMVGKIKDVRCALTAVAPDPCELWLLQPRSSQPTFAGSPLSESCDGAWTVPEIDWSAEHEAMELLSRLAEKQFISAARDVGAGGVMAGTLGLTLTAKLTPQFGTNGLVTELDFFGELPGSYLLAVPAATVDRFQNSCTELVHNRVRYVGALKPRDSDSWTVGKHVFSWTTLMGTHAAFIPF